MENAFLVGTNWHFSHPAHLKKRRITPLNLKKAYFYTNNRQGKMLQNTGTSHRWTKLPKSSSSSRRLIVVGSGGRPGRKTVNVPSGYSSCSCPRHLSRRNWAMGRLPHWNCGDTFRASTSGTRITVRRTDRGGRDGHGWGMSLRFYCTCFKKGQKGDQNGHAVCTKPKTDGSLDFTFSGYKFVRTAVKGVMNSENILAACKKKGLRPVCNHAHYADGQCKTVGGSWHFSYPPHNSRFKVPTAVRGAFFYCGRGNRNKALYNIGTTHKWTNGQQRDGSTYCVKRTKAFAKDKLTFTYNNVVAHRTAVKGKMTNANAVKACKARDMKPVCDRSSYYDGQCVITSRNWHISHPSQSKSIKRRVYVHMGAGGRPGTKVKTVPAGYTCAKVLNKRNWAMGRRRHWNCGDTFAVTVKGNKLTVKRTDPRGKDGHGWGMDLRFYCTQTISKIPQDVSLGAFFYTNNAQGKMLMSQGNRHKWTSGTEKDGDTFCAAESNDDRNLVWGGYKFIRVSVKGVMNSANILKACKAMKMKPVCDKGKATSGKNKYDDGKCANVHRAKWHFSHPCAPFFLALLRAVAVIG